MPLPTAAPALDLVTVESAEIRVDGRADEAEWAHAGTVPDPTPHHPSADVVPVGSASTRMFADAVALYVHVAVTDPEPALIRRGLGRRDGRLEDDLVGILLDPAGDGRRAWVFVCNPLGVQGDGVHLAGGDEDGGWDANWSCAAHLTETGWEAEFAIPWAAARMGGDVDGFGLVLLRELSRRGQSYAWPPVPVGTDPLLSAAHVKGPGRLPRRLGLEIRPELTAGWRDPPAESPRLSLYGVSPGLTARWAPGGPASASATFNPDFSQLESDATQLDINARYALSYAEKRPFFLEGQDWFTQPFDGAVYTRQVNAPVYGVRGAVEAGDVGVAVLHAMDLAPPPSVSEGGGWTSADLDGHAALATLGRVRLGFRDDSYAGLFVSDRSVLDTDLSNRVVGIDGRVRLAKEMVVEAEALGSATVLAPESEPVLAPAARIDATWSGKRLWAHGRFDAIAPGFRAENGYFPREDLFGELVEANWTLFPEAAWVSRVSLEAVDVRSYWHFDGTLRELVYDPSVWATLGNGGIVKLDAALGGEEFAGVWIPYQNGEIYAQLPFSSAVGVNAGATVGTSPYYDPADPRAGRLYRGWLDVTLQPWDRLTIAIGPEGEHMDDLDGTPIYTAWTARARTQVFFTRQGWARIVGERSVQADVETWRVEPVVAWEWSPGRAAYLGGAVGDDGAPFREVFAKLSWAFGV